MKAVMAVLLVLVLVTFVFPMDVQSEVIVDGASGQDGIYVVQPGDNLWNISERDVAQQWLAWKAANPQLANPNLIYPGQQLNAPAGSALASTTVQLSAVPNFDWAAFWLSVPWWGWIIGASLFLMIVLALILAIDRGHCHHGAGVTHNHIPAVDVGRVAAEMRGMANDLTRQHFAEHRPNVADMALAMRLALQGMVIRRVGPVEATAPSADTTSDDGQASTSASPDTAAAAPATSTNAPSGSTTESVPAGAAGPDIPAGPKDDEYGVLITRKGLVPMRGDEEVSWEEYARACPFPEEDDGEPDAIRSEIRAALARAAATTSEQPGERSFNPSGG